MLMSSLLDLVILLILVILNTKLLILLARHTVRLLSPDRLSFWQLMVVRFWCLLNWTTLFTLSAVATYLPKRKADKKKSLLGNPKDSAAESNAEIEVGKFAYDFNVLVGL